MMIFFKVTSSSFHKFVASMSVAFKIEFLQLYENNILYISESLMQLLPQKGVGVLSPNSDQGP